MATVYSFEKIKQMREAHLSSFPDLECPKCNALCRAAIVDTSETVTYVCQGNGHAKLVWRINSKGEMLRGGSGNKFY